jgi:ubiquinone/menaquinone biosynthesis C-methylase UbiE
MKVNKDIEKYWKNRVLFSWGKYEDMRDLRYGINHYMHNFYPFEKSKDKKVLEIGCGGGLDSIEYAKNGAQVWATDFTDEAVEFTTNRVKRLNLDNIRVDKVDVRNIQYEDNFFDVVHTFGVLHHIIEVEDALSEIYRVLKPGGSMYAMFYNKNSLLYYYSIMYLRGVVGGEFDKGLSEEDLVSKYSEAQFGCPYTKIYTEESVKELFYDNGFDNVETQIDSPHIDTLETRKVKIPNLPKNMGWHLSTKATK